MFRSFLAVLIPFAIVWFCLPVALADPPTGWITAGSHPKAYEMSVDATLFHSGGKSAYLKSIETEIDGFGTLMQTFGAKQYQGQRVRMSGYVKSQEVQGWAGLWMRVDGPDQRMPLAFDNMQSRAIKGTTDWRRYEIVLDVANEATAIAFGLLLHGTGQAWMDDIAFEVVGKNVPTTNMYQGTVKAGESNPANLDFESSQ